MTESSLPSMSLYFPLWGAVFNSDKVGSITPGVTIYNLGTEEWHLIQKTDVWKAQLGSEGGRPEGPTPPCCIVIRTAIEPADTIDTAIKQLGQLLISLAGMAVTSLRLSRPGWFLQPEQAMYVFFSDAFASNIRRFPGPYRQVFVSGSSSAPSNRYQLSLDDLLEGVNTGEPIMKTWELLEEYRLTGGSASVEIAIESFNLSYGYQLRPPSRAANLFTALDAMLGGMSAWRIGRVPVKPRGYARRVEAGLRTAASPTFPGKLHDTAQWLHSSNGGRGLRNAIAHGTGDNVVLEAEKAYERLQAIVRVLLRQYVQFAIAWARQREQIIDRLDLPSESLLTAAYVKTLEAEARQPGSMLDLLKCSGRDLI